MSSHEDAAATFLGIASHDFRGPLSNVRSHAGLLLDPRLGLEGRARRSAEAIVRNADRLLDLMLEYFADQRSKIGALQLLPERQAALDLLRETVEKTRVHATHAGVTLEVHLPSHEVNAVFDASALPRSVAAFIEHGIARASPGDQVLVAAELNGKGLRLAVTDPTAFSQDPRVYFNSLERALAEGKLGPGYRVAVAKAEIEAQGGCVGVHVEPGKTTIFFVLPP